MRTRFQLGVSPGANRRSCTNPACICVRDLYCPADRRKRGCPGRTANGGFTLIELMVYLAALVLVIGVAYSAMYHCVDSSVALRGDAEDISRALQAGENWRADVRAATGPVHLGTSPEGPVIRIPTVKGAISYQFRGNTVFRRVGGSPWSAAIASIRNSSFMMDSRHNLTSWRWELELRPRSKSPRVHPLFTFVSAAPTAPPK